MTSTAVESAPVEPRTPEEGGRGRPRGLVVVLFLSFAGLAFTVLQSVVAPALPLIAHDVEASTGDVSWVLTAYLLSASVLTPVLGRLGDLAGKRRVLVAVLAVLGVGTAVSALAGSLSVLIVGRALQGAGGAILPLSVGIVRDELPAERVSVTVGLLSAFTGVGGGIGIVAAGPIVDHLSWPWLFWLPLVIVRTIGGCLGTAVIAAVIARDSTAEGQPLDAAFTHGFWVCAAVCLVTVLAAIALPSARRRDSRDLSVDDLSAMTTAR